MLRPFIRNNVTLVSIILFMTLFFLIPLIKPAVFYKSDGSIRDFGVGYKNKTIMPLWLFSILLGILCYLFVLYYLAQPKLFY
jgi:hypothetical protein